VPADPISPLTSSVQVCSAWVQRGNSLGEEIAPGLGGLKNFRWKLLSGPGKASFSPADQLATSVTFSAPGDYLLRLTASEGQESVTRDVAVKASLAPLDQWKERRFGADRSRWVLAGDHADADADGISNLMEYALMLDPRKPDVAGLPDPVVRNGGLSIVYKRPASAVDVKYQAQWTEDLLEWSGDEVKEEVILTVGDMQIVRASAPAPKDKPGRFLRLRVTGP
jgi:hypothetical protein